MPNTKADYSRLDLLLATFYEQQRGTIKEQSEGNELIAELLICELYKELNRNSKFCNDFKARSWIDQLALDYQKEPHIERKSNDGFTWKNSCTVREFFMTIFDPAG